MEQEKLKEPDFIKLYFNDISLLYQLSQPATHLFLELIQLVEYNPTNLHNVILLNKPRKHKIFSNLNWDKSENNSKSKYAMFGKYCKELITKKIINKIEEDIFLINPNLCGKTSWTNLQLVKAISLNITYDIVGRTLVSVLEGKEDFSSEIIDSVKKPNKTVTPLKTNPKVKNYLSTGIWEQENIIVPTPEIEQKNEFTDNDLLF